MICDVCGAEAAPGKRFCPVCGAPLSVPPLGAQPPVYDAPAHTPYQPAQSPANLKTPAQQVSANASTMLPPPGVNTELIDEILKDDEKKTKSAGVIWKKPEFWLILSSALLIPAILLPWMRIAPNATLSAFRLPLTFLITGHLASPALLSTGAILALCAVASIALCFKKDFSATWLRIAAVVVLVTALFAVFSAFRSWNVLIKNPDMYKVYVYGQLNELSTAFGKTDMFLGSTSKNPDAADVTGVPQKGISFVTKYLGFGVFFALLSSISVLVLTKVFASSLKFADYYIESTPLAAIISTVAIAVILIMMNLFFPAAWLRLGAAFWNGINNKARAEITLKECVALPVPSLACEMNLGKLYYDSNRLKEAYKLFITVNERFPNYVEVDKYLGVIYFKDKNYYKSAGHLRKYLKVNPGDIDARKKLADILNILASESISRRDYPTALRRLLEACSLVPQLKNKEETNYKISKLYDATGDYKNAAEYLGRAAQISKQDWSIQEEAAKAYGKAGDDSKALDYYSQCVTAQPTQLRCYIQAGDIARDKFKDSDLATQWYQKGITANDVGAESDILRQRIRELE